MKLRHLLMPSLSSLIMLGCVREVSNNYSNKQPIAVNASVTMSSIQASTVTRSGKFVSGEHSTQGTVRITSQDGKFILELEQSFKTSDSGPDLVVILHRSNNVINSTNSPSYPLAKGDYIILAPLQKYSGAQTYAIPNDINLSDYKSVAIWCRKFNATFGAANLI